GGAGQMFADLNPRGTGSDRLELAAEFDGRLRLGIKRLVVARPAVHPDQNAAFGLRRRRGVFLPESLSPKQRGQPHTAGAPQADLQEIAPRVAVAIAVVHRTDSPKLVPASKRRFFSDGVVLTVASD